MSCVTPPPPVCSVREKCVCVCVCQKNPRVLTVCPSFLVPSGCWCPGSQASARSLGLCPPPQTVFASWPLQAKFLDLLPPSSAKPGTHSISSCSARGGHTPKKITKILYPLPKLLHQSPPKEAGKPGAAQQSVFENDKNILKLFDNFDVLLALRERCQKYF